MKPDTELWVEVATDDLGLAKVALENGFYRQSVFQCHQAVEKLLKAMWVEQPERGAHPHIHNLLSLADALQLVLSAEQRDFLRMLTAQYTPTRYGVATGTYPEAVASRYYTDTDELFRWLRQKLS